MGNEILQLKGHIEASSHIVSSLKHAPKIPFVLDEEVVAEFGVLMGEFAVGTFQRRASGFVDGPVGGLVLAAAVLDASAARAAVHVVAVNGAKVTSREKRVCWGRHDDGVLGVYMFVKGN
jgi:hypothetical protein